jgi:hypothetical protein
VARGSVQLWKTGGCFVHSPLDFKPQMSPQMRRAVLATTTTRCWDPGHVILQEQTTLGGAAGHGHGSQLVRLSLGWLPVTRAVHLSKRRGKRLSIQKDDLNNSFPGNVVLVVHHRWVWAQDEKVWTGNVQGSVPLTHGRLRFGRPAAASEREFQRSRAIVNLDGAILFVVQFVS